MCKSNLKCSEGIHHSIQRLGMDATPGVFCGFLISSYMSSEKSIKSGLKFEKDNNLEYMNEE